MHTHFFIRHFALEMSTQFLIIIDLFEYAVLSGLLLRVLFCLLGFFSSTRYKWNHVEHIVMIFKVYESLTKSYIIFGDRMLVSIQSVTRYSLLASFLCSEKLCTPFLIWKKKWVPLSYKLVSYKKKLCILIFESTATF